MSVQLFRGVFSSWDKWCIPVVIKQELQVEQYFAQHYCVFVVRVRPHVLTVGDMTLVP